MNKELKDWTRGIYESIENCIERMKNNTLSEKDRTSHSIMLVELAQAFRSDEDYSSDPVMQDTAGRLLDSFSALKNDNVELLELKNDEIRQLTIHGEILVSEEDKRRFKSREDGRTYIDFLPLMPHEQYLQVVENLKNMGAKYDTDARQWYIDKDWQPEINRTENLKEQNTSEAETVDERKENATMNEHESAVKPQFKAIYYDGNERKELYVDTKESAMQAVKEAKKIGLKETDRCYLQEYNAEADHYEQEGIYLIDSGRDVTPVEIKFPYMSSETFKQARSEIKEMGAKFNADKKSWYIERSAGEEAVNQIKECLARHDEGLYLNLPENTTKEQFKELVTQLKENGARYNPDKKAWYITNETDRSKFSEYLPSEKPSVREKLSRNQSIAKNNQEKERAMEPKNKDTHERA